MVPVSADERINFVDDPVIFEKNGKERSYHPQSPALTSQGAANRQTLHENVHKEGGAVPNIGQRGKYGEEQTRMQRKRRMEMGPSGEDPDHTDHGEANVL